MQTSDCINLFIRKVFSVVICIVIASPFSFCKEKSTTIVATISIGALIRESSNHSNDQLLNKAIDETGIAKEKSKTGFVKLFGAIFQKENPGYKMATLFVRSGQNDLSLNESNEGVIAALSDRADTAIRHTCNVLKGRLKKIDSSVKVQYVAEKETINIVFTGSVDIDRIRKCISSPGNLQFLEAYTNLDILAELTLANDALAASTRDKKDSLPDGIFDVPGKSKEDKEVLRKNPLFTLLQMNLRGDEPAKSPVIGYVLKRDTARLNKCLHFNIVKSILPADARFIYGTSKESGDLLPVYAVKIPDKKDTVLDGSYISGSRSGINSDYSIPYLRIEMNASGTILFREITRRNIGRFIAIVLDDVVYSCPRVEDQISGGSVEISGQFTMPETLDFANILTLGKLELPVYIFKISQDD